MKAIYKVTILLSLFIISSTNVFGWGMKGHNIVTEIAERHLTPKAKEEVRKVLGGYSLIYYSTWMDETRDDSRFNSTSTWHYINVDDDMVNLIHLTEGTVLSATSNMIAALMNKEQLSDSLKTLYTKFLIHVVADLHCPMHTGKQSDRGGNKHPIIYRNQTTNLHTFWDDTIIEAVRHWSYTEWCNNIDVVSELQAKEFIAGNENDWLNETIIIGRDIYNKTPINSTVSYSYIFGYYRTLELQLLKAGYRLADVLNKIYS